MVANIDEIKLQNDTYYMLLPCGLGDTFVMGQLHQYLESKYNSQIIYIIPKKQEIILNSMGIKSYIAYESPIEFMDYFELAEAVPNPKKGNIFVAHPQFHPNKHYVVTEAKDFLSMYLKFLDLDENIKIKHNFKLPNLTPSTREKFESIAKLDNICIVCPEATSITFNQDNYWENKVKFLNKKGYKVITNCINPKNAIKNSVYFNISLQELIEIAPYVNSIYSVRSGICDILACLPDNKLRIIYDTQERLDFYSVNNLYNVNSVKEIIHSNSTNTTKYTEDEYFLFGFIPLLKIKAKWNETYKKKNFYLFKFIKIFKISTKYNEK